MAKKKTAGKNAKLTSKVADKKAAPRVPERTASGQLRVVPTTERLPPAGTPKEWQGGRIVFDTPPAKPVRGRGSESVPLADLRDAQGHPIPQKVCDWFARKLDASHKMTWRPDGSYDAAKESYLSPEAAQLLRQEAATWARLADAERDDARKREQESLDSLTMIAAPTEFHDGKVILAKPKQPVAKEYCWKPDFDGEVYQAVLHYYGYLPAEHVGSITDPNGYPAKAMSPEAAQLYRAHRAFWEGKHVESKTQSKAASTARRQAAEVNVDKAAASAGLSRVELEAKLDRLGMLLEENNLQLVADMIAGFGDAWLYEALLAGSSVEPDGDLKPGKILKRFKKRANFILVLALAAMPEGLSLDPLLHRDALINIDVGAGMVDILAEISPRLPNLKPRLNYGDLADLEELGLPAAEFLARCEAGLSLAVKRLGVDAAASLAKHEGELALWQLETIDPTVAAALAQHQGALTLGLNELPDEIAAALALHQGDLEFLSLIGLSKAAAAALEKHTGTLSLRGVGELDAETARHLGRHAGPVRLPSVRQLSYEAAVALAAQSHGVELSIEDLPAGDLAVRLCQRMAAGPGIDLCLPIKSLNAECAAALAAFHGEYLRLGNLNSLSSDCATALAAFRGTLSLDVKAWEEDALIALAQHQGELRIDPTSLSTSAATALSQRGSSTRLTISSYQAISLSDEAADALRTYPGELASINGLEISPIAAKLLAQRHSLIVYRSRLKASIRKIFESAGTWRDTVWTRHSGPGMDDSLPRGRA